MTFGKPLRVVVSASIVVTVALLVVPRRIVARDPVPVTKKGDERPFVKPIGKAIAKPVNSAEIEIPDNPPPHEGAMFTLPYRIAAPDIIDVEVLEALPGRPISGDRLVRPDGTITLGFYGNLYVVGLTPVQVKEKVVIHLRSFLTDESLGLVAERFPDGEAAAAMPEPPPTPPSAPPDLPPIPDEDPPFPKIPDTDPKPKKTVIVATPPGGRIRLARLRQLDRAAFFGQRRESARRESLDETRTTGPESSVNVVQSGTNEGDWEASLRQTPLTITRGQVMVHPRDSDRVFVDIASYNSKVYFVLGDVNNPGRFPWTGNETVLDALQSVGDLAPSADPKHVRLVRPARGKKPAKVYPIDMAAIRDRGDSKANLQLFPGDRLVIGRSAATESAVKLNADAARTNTLLNTALTYAFVLRNFDRLGEMGSAKDSSELSIKLNGQTLKIILGEDGTRFDPARRKAALKAFHEYWSKTSRAGGAEEARLMEEMMKVLDK